MSRWKQLIKLARRARESDVHRFYIEVFGADFAGKVTVERARQSIIEACEELMASKDKKLAVAKSKKETDGAKAAKAAAKAKKAAPPKEAKGKGKAAEKGKARGEDFLAQKIKLLVKENPKRGTAAERFEKYKDGMTVAEYLKKGGRPGDVRWDAKKQFIELKAA